MSDQLESPGPDSPAEKQSPGVSSTSNEAKLFGKVERLLFTHKKTQPDVVTYVNTKRSNLCLNEPRKY